VSTTDAIEELRVILRDPKARIDAATEMEEIDTEPQIKALEMLKVDPEPMTTDEAELLAAAAAEDYHPEGHEPYIPDHQERAGMMADDVPGESFGLDALDVPDDKEV